MVDVRVKGLVYMGLGVKITVAEMRILTCSGDLHFRYDSVNGSIGFVMARGEGQGFMSNL